VVAESVTVTAPVDVFVAVVNTDAPSWVSVGA